MALIDDPQSVADEEPQVANPARLPISKNRELFLKKKREDLKKIEEDEFLKIENQKIHSLKNPPDKSVKKVEDRLLGYQKGYDAHRKELQQSLVQRQAKELSFKPDIHAKSSKNLEYPTRK